jgi:hypothetical protein
MEERELRNNYFFILIKFVLFLIIFCFMVEISKEFFKEIKLKESFKINTLYLSILFPFLFYTFVADMNSTYRKIQNFFFRSTFLTYYVPALLIFLGISFILLPKVFNISFNKDVFIFLGGSITTIHLIFVARQNKGSNFSTFINYLFTFSILYIINLILFILYLRINFSLSLGSILAEGLRKGASLIYNIFTQVFK